MIITHEHASKMRALCQEHVDEKKACYDLDPSDRNKEVLLSAMNTLDYWEVKDFYLNIKCLPSSEDPLFI